MRARARSESASRYRRRGDAAFSRLPPRRREESSRRTSDDQLFAARQSTASRVSPRGRSPTTHGASRWTPGIRAACIPCLSSRTENHLLTIYEGKSKRAPSRFSSHARVRSHARRPERDHHGAAGLFSGAQALRYEAITRRTFSARRFQASLVKDTKRPLSRSMQKLFVRKVLPADYRCFRGECEFVGKAAERFREVAETARRINNRAVPDCFSRSGSRLSLIRISSLSLGRRRL